MSMAAAARAAARAPGRAAARFVQTRLRSSGKVLSEEERAAENVYIKKMEQEKREKLARKGPSTGEQAPSTPSAGAGDVNTAGAGSTTSASAAGTSTDKNRNYAVLAGTLAGLSALGWYLLSKPKKTEEVVD
ncbi:hypothetical protein CFC21_056018 [Triticum aestivum]|uniref:Uncharacterized protein n=3 Tax=Triticum TaxID=4564 RepID=A0A9R0SSD9_TRITD|nr:uncharacterized protein At2g27730, mitochondrial-like isoform X2 [Triticum aestivum]KAF7047040.1 hypothetical protein CFC21_056018 [Triticum aestivum]VAI00487.1 unnamed protein product [Triticum turgidum subsp. durum]